MLCSFDVVASAVINVSKCVARFVSLFFCFFCHVQLLRQLVRRADDGSGSQRKGSRLQGTVPRHQAQPGWRRKGTYVVIGCRASFFFFQLLYGRVQQGLTCREIFLGLEQMFLSPQVVCSVM